MGRIRTPVDYGSSLAGRLFNPYRKSRFRRRAFSITVKLYP